MKTKSPLSASQLGAGLRRLRVAAGLTQDQLAVAIGLTGPNRRKPVERLEGGRIRKPTLEVVIRYLRACGARWSQFVELADSLTPEAPLKRPYGHDSARFRSYRAVTGRIEQAVSEELKRTDLSPAGYAIYKAVARHSIGVLWRETKRAVGGKLRAANQTRLRERLAAKDSEWRRQKLDMALVARVQGIAVEEFAKLVREQPELFGAD